MERFRALVAQSLRLIGSALNTGCPRPLSRVNSMRTAFGLSLLLLGALWLAATLGLQKPVESQATSWKDAPVGTQWRRTAGGWQRVDEVVNREDQRQFVSTSLSPLVVASLLVCISVLALLVFPARAKTPTTSDCPKSVPPPVSKRRPDKKNTAAARS